MPKRSQAADRVALLHGEELRRPLAHRLQYDLDVLPIGTVDREWSPQERTRRPSEIDELPGTHGDGDLGRVHRDDEHVACDLPLSDERSIKQEHRAYTPR